MKYIIDVKDNETLYKAVIGNDGEPYITPATGNVSYNLEAIQKKAYEEGHKLGYIAGYEKADKAGAKFYDDGYQRGLRDAWEAARKIGSNSMCSLKEMGFDFGQCVVNDYNPSWFVVKNYSASECIEKIRQYEQAQEEQIQVGDEVIGAYTGGGKTEPFVVIRKIQEIDPAYYFGIYSKSGEFCQGGLKLKKTGRHFPEIAEVLRKMKGEKNGD